MKTLARLTLVLCAIAPPALSFAQPNNDPMTRTEARADLVRGERIGLEMGVSDDFIGVEDLLAQAYEDEVYAALAGTQTPPIRSSVAIWQG